VNISASANEALAEMARTAGEEELFHRVLLFMVVIVTMTSIAAAVPASGRLWNSSRDAR
jgi:hypothetical protein